MTGQAETLRWADLAPEPGMLAALEAADGEQPRSAIEAEAAEILTAGLSRAERSARRAPLRDRRKRWSELLAGATATMIADELRRHRAITRRFRVAPAADGTGQETFWPLGYRSGKRIDVVVAGELSGLQLGVSLKALNFRDDESGNYDKNLTGRLYELADEMTTVHRHLPRATMAGVVFMPIEACTDKANGQSSFAHAVLELRRRSGRQAGDPSHLNRCDFAAVGLYSWGAGDITRGVVRFLPVTEAPPRAGLPPLASTVDTGGLIERIVGLAIAETAAADVYGPAEDTTSAPQPALPDVIAAEESGELDELSLEE